MTKKKYSDIGPHGQTLLKIPRRRIEWPRLAEKESSDMGPHSRIRLKSPGAELHWLYFAEKKSVGNYERRID